MRRRRPLPRSWEWHCDMMAQGTPPYMQADGIRTWDQLRVLCARLVSQWERSPSYARQPAFPNPEDRRPAKGKTA